MRTKVVRIFNLKFVRFCNIFEKDDSTEILKNIGDVLKIDGHHPQSEELEEAAIESDTDIIMIPRDEN